MAMSLAALRHNASNTAREKQNAHAENGELLLCALGASVMLTSAHGWGVHGDDVKAPLRL
jgi:hypothetical protein